MEDIQGWIDNFNRNPPIMWVMDPETNQGSGWMSKPVTTYLIKLSNNEIAFSANGIRKRYSEFEQLKAILDVRYQSEGLFVPPLPPKNSMSTQDEDFVKSRAMGLSFFMEGIAKSPFLTRDLTVEKFLTKGLDQSDSDGVTVDLLKKNEESTDNKGFVRWLEYVNTFPDCPDGDMKINALKNELDIVTKQLRDMMDKFKLYTQSILAFERNAKVMSSSMTCWKDCELSSDSLNDINPSPHRNTSEMVGAISNLVDSVTPPSSITSQLDISFYERIHYELNCLNEIGALIKKRDDVFGIIYKHQTRIQRILSMNQQKQKEKAAELEAEKLQQQRFQEQHDRITKAIVWISLPLAAKNRNENIMKACNNFAAVMASINYNALNSCFDYFNIIDEVPTNSINSLNEGLIKLSIDPVVGVIESKYDTTKTIESNLKSDHREVSGAGNVKKDQSKNSNGGMDYQSSILISAALDNKETILDTVVENKDLLTVENVTKASDFAQSMKQHGNDPFSAFP